MSTQAGSTAPSDLNPGDLDITPDKDIRRRVRDLLAGYSGITVDDAVLVVDELISNAHRHGQSPRACRLVLINQGRRLRVEVDDTCPHPPRIRAPRPDRRTRAGPGGPTRLDLGHTTPRRAQDRLGRTGVGPCGQQRSRSAPRGSRGLAAVNPTSSRLALQASADGAVSSSTTRHGPHQNRPRGTEPPPTGLDIVRRFVDGTLVVAIAGEIDTDTAPALHTAVITAIDDTIGKDCILDLTAVTFLGSAGLTALALGTAHAEARREPLRIVVDANRPVIRPIEVTGMNDVLRLYHTVDEALTAASQPQRIRHPPQSRSQHWNR